MTGFLIPAWYVEAVPSRLDMNVASIIWGVSLAASLFTASKAAKQSWAIYKRKKRLNAYVWLIWIEWIASTLIGVLSWFFLWGSIEHGFAIYFSFLVIWVFQIQCIMQIIINRIGLLVREQRSITRLKWGCAIGMGLINISVFCIWIPARLQISPTWIHINEIWDRIEKAIFCLMDAGLNLYFIYLVRSKLISNGLTKYNRLFHHNLIMIACSVSLDIILIGVMSLGFIYVQFHPLVYMFKLHIELNMADLIAKIVKMENGGSYPSGSNPTNPTNPSRYGNGTKHNGTGAADPRGYRMGTMVTCNRDFANEHEHDANEAGKHPLGGIQKTVETEVRHTDEDARSSSSSTAELQKQYGVGI